MACPEVKKKAAIETEVAAGMMEAIRRRKAVRSYGPQPVDRSIVDALLRAAVQTPTITRVEPWAFAVIQDRALLEQLSEFTKQSVDAEMRARLQVIFRQKDFNIFYNAGTLVVIYSRPAGPAVVADCWLAAENLMLAACSMRLGACVIELAVPALNTPEWKNKLGMAADMTAYVPLVLGVPDVETLPVSRKAPETVVWR